jgi:hypothetical protein
MGNGDGHCEDHQPGAQHDRGFHREPSIRSVGAVVRGGLGHLHLPIVGHCPVRGSGRHQPRSSGNRRARRPTTGTATARWRALSQIATDTDWAATNGPDT